MTFGNASAASTTAEFSQTNPAVGTITTSPVQFIQSVAQAVTQFDPIGMGTSIISIVAPVGVSTPSNLESITATVQ